MRALLWVILLVVGGVVRAVALGAEQPCDIVVGVLGTDFNYRVPSSQSARVDVRQCSPGDSATIQLVAWRSGEATPALVINTDDFGVVQTAARGNVFVIETGGATRDQVFVIVYDRGEPKLALKRVTKGSARITLSSSAVDLIIDGIYAGDSPPRVETQHFALDSEGMKPR
jgi:hypothetical protein